MENKEEKKTEGMENMNGESKQTSAADVMNKLIDMIAAPVHLVCTYMKKPADAISAQIEISKEKKKRQMEHEEKLNDLEIARQEKKLDGEVANQLRREAEEMEIDIRRLEHEEDSRWHRDMIKIIEEYRTNTIELGQRCLENFGNMRIELRQKAAETFNRETDLLREKYEKESAKIKQELSSAMEICGDNTEMKNQIMQVLMDNLKEDMRVNTMLLQRTDEIIRQYAENEDYEIGKFENEAIEALGYKTNLKIEDLKGTSNQTVGIDEQDIIDIKDE